MMTHMCLCKQLNIRWDLTAQKALKMCNTLGQSNKSTIARGYLFIYLFYSFYNSECDASVCTY